MPWDQSVDMLITGQAAMIASGDWIERRFQDWKFTDFGWVPFPDSNGIFDVVSDGFAMPKASADSEDARAWMEYNATPEAQDAFNAANGSLPARTGALRSAYTDYKHSASVDYQKDELVPSAVYGSAASEAWAAKFLDVIRAFRDDGDVVAAQGALGQACLDVGACSA